MDSRTDRSHGDSIWLRLVFMILFAIAFNVAEIILAVIAVVQFLSKAVTGRVITQGTAFGQNLATYIYEVMLFLTFRSEEMPWPFAPWPDGPPAEARRRTTTAAGPTPADIAE